jgi:CelD/BcsL family acetyltransferase involved in cellulose biosynthesis
MGSLSVFNSSHAAALGIRGTFLNGADRFFSVRIADPLSDPVWSTLTAACPAAGLFHSPPWMRAISDSYGFQIRACIAVTPSGEPAGGLAYCEVDDFSGRRLIALPFSDVCDPLIIDGEAWPAMLTALQSNGLPLSFRCLHEDRVAQTDGIQVVKKARWHRIRIDAPLEQLWSRISPESKRAIRRSERLGLTVRPLAGDQDRADFHALHVGLRKSKYRLLAQSPLFFEALERRFQQLGAWKSLGAFLDSRMLAGTIYLHWGDTLYYKFNASLPDTARTRPNNRLVWEGMRLASELGCRYLDLGPSDDDQPGLIRFKRNFGAEQHELSFLRWTPTDWQDCQDRRQLLTELTKALTETAVPSSITAQAGSVLYRFFA